MYNLNKLLRNVLITVPEVVFHAPTRQTLDERAIEHSIIVAEERFIRPALGDLFYRQLCTQKNTVVTSDNQATLQARFEAATLEVGDVVNAYEFLSADNLTLWKEHLWKLCAECVMLLALPEGFVQFGSEGVIHTAPSAGPMNTTGNNTPELKSVRWAMDKKLQDRIDPLLNAMKDWLCFQNKVLTPKPYVLYPVKCDCEPESGGRKTGILFIYDDEKEPCCDGW